MSIARAEADLQRLESQASDLRGRLAGIEARIDKIRVYLEVARAYDTTLSDVGWTPTPSKGGRPPGGVSTRAVEAAIQIIESEGKPIHTRVLLARLRERGIEIGGTNPAANLSGFLSRSTELKNNRANGWQIIKVSEYKSNIDNSTDAE